MKASNLDSGVLTKLIDAVVAQTIAEVGDVISIWWSADLEDKITFRIVLNDGYSDATFSECNRRLGFSDYGISSMRYFRTISECNKLNDPEWK